MIDRITGQPFGGKVIDDTEVKIILEYLDKSGIVISPGLAYVDRGIGLMRKFLNSSMSMLAIAQDSIGAIRSPSVCSVYCRYHRVYRLQRSTRQQHPRLPMIPKSLSKIDVSHTP